MNFLKSGIAACAAIMLVSCGAPHERTEASATAAQNLYVSNLIMKAGLAQPPAAGDGNWAVVAEAGIYDIERQCDQYLDLLARANRSQGGASTTPAAGAASIAVTAAALGLPFSPYVADTRSLLVTTDPSALRAIVMTALKNYLANIDRTKINSRPRLMIALQGYLSQCSPAAIEANVSQAPDGDGSAISASPAAARAAALASPAATFIERAALIVGQPVAATPPAPEDDLARNRKPSEAAVSKRLLIAAQKALGIMADGNFGVPGDSETRPAIEQFQSGRNRRNPAQWPAVDVNGELSGRTGELLPFLSPLAPVFRTPFERAFLGNDAGALGQRLTEVSAAQLTALLDTVRAPDFQVAANSPPDVLAAKMKELRDKLADLRKARGIEPGKGGALDAQLYDSLISQPP